MTEEQAPYGKRKFKYRHAADALIEDPGVSYWLKDAITDLEGRDPVDALKDVAVLFELEKTRVEESLSKDQDSQETSKEPKP